MTKELVIYKGERMIKGWPEKIEAAQSHPRVVINGKEFQRIRYGKELKDWGSDRHSCRDCGVTKDQIHVIGCDVEQCALCGGQAITCDCDYEDGSED